MNDNHQIVACGNCATKIRAPAQLAGRTVKCPKCRQPLVIPRLAEPQVKEPPAVYVFTFTPRLMGLTIGVVALLAVVLVVIVLANRGTENQVTSEPPKTKAPTPEPAGASKSDGVVSVDGFDDYYVEVDRTDDKLTMVNVTFRKLPPSSDVASKIVRKAMEKAVAKDGSREILAMAFDGPGKSLPDTHYGGPLVYTPKDSRILTMNEREGLKNASKDEGSYFVRVEEGKTATGIRPERKWLTCKIVFAQTPSSEQVMSAATSEIEKLKGRQLDVTVYAYTGDKSNMVTWRQVRASNGKYMVVEYKKQSGSIKSNW